MKAFLFREIWHDCMRGGLSIEGGFQCLTLELPWRNNEPFISCIPEGVYICRLRESSLWSPAPPFLYEVMGVPGREDVFIHAGNRVANTKGCPLVGESFVDDPTGPTFLQHSRKTLMRLHQHTQGRPFTLTVSSK